MSSASSPSLSVSTSKYIANVDGSHHAKSGVSGWGFVIYKGQEKIHSDSGPVPNEFSQKHEQYAFAQMLNFVSENGIENLHVKTDLSIMATRLSEMTLGELFIFAQGFLPEIKQTELNFSIEHISRKFNKEADTLSKHYIYSLFRKEKQDILENCYPFGHENINFLQMPEMRYALRSTSHDVVNRVYHALKRRHLFIKFDADETDIKFEIYKNVDGEKVVSQSGKLPKSEGVMENLFCNFVMPEVEKCSKKLVMVVENQELYHQLIGYIDGEFSPNNCEALRSIADGLNDFYIYWETPKRKNATPKKSKSLKSEIQNLSSKDAIAMLKANSSKRIRQMLISIYIYEFQKQFKRSPNQEEMKEIVKSVDNDNS